MSAANQIINNQATSEKQHELAAELLEISNEEELDRFIPLLIGPALAGLKALAPLALKAAAPLVKSLAAKALPMLKTAATQGLAPTGQSPTQGAGAPRGAGSRRRRQPAPGPSRAAGGLDRQEQFLGDILGGLFGGELESEQRGDAQLDLALRFVQLAQRAARKSAAEVIRVAREGRPPTEAQTRKIVLQAMLQSARRVAPSLLPEGFDVEGATRAPLIDAIAASAKPLPAAALAGPPAAKPVPGAAVSSGTPAAPSARATGPSATPVVPGRLVQGGSGRARWVREGNKLILSF